MFVPSEPGEIASLGGVVVDWLDELPGPFHLTDEQGHLLADWYRLDPVTGDRVWRRGQIMAAKGWGKSPLAALVALAELAGPVVFDRWGTDRDGRPGRPFGRPWPSPVIQIAAVSEDQADNTYGALLEYLTAKSGAVADRLGLDAGQTRILRRGQPAARIDAVTASAGTREGQRVTFAVLDESHLWLPGNGGHRLAGTLRRNAGKMGGSTLETTNAYVPGEQSVAQATAEAAGAEGIFRWCRQPAGEVSLANKAELRSALRYVYGEATEWVSVDRLVREIYDPATTEADARRFFLNEVVEHAGGAFDSARWAELAAPAEVVADGELVTLGFDGARFHDATAIVGCRVSDGHLFLVGCWERPPGVGDDGWEVPASEVDAVVHQAFTRWDVWRLYADPPRWQDEVDRWAGEFADRAVKWETYRVKQMAFAIRRFDEALRAGALSHDGDSTLARHVGNAYRAATKIRDDEGRWLWRIEKEHPKSSRKIDAAMAAVLAFEARGDAVASGAGQRPKSFVPRRIR
ncbi:MAG: phage terminase family protein [Actinomycetota bacterium]|nr:phage terminase family protein [Actinomycetota bacterium]